MASPQPNLSERVKQLTILYSPRSVVRSYDLEGNHTTSVVCARFRTRKKDGLLRSVWTDFIQTPLTPGACHPDHANLRHQSHPRQHERLATTGRIRDQRYFLDSESDCVGRFGSAV